MKFDERFISGIRQGEITLTCRRVSMSRPPVDAERSYSVQRWNSQPRDEFNEPLKIRKGPRAGERLHGVWEALNLRIIVRSLERGQLHQLTDEDAAEAGFDSAHDLFDWWREKYNEGPGHGFAFTPSSEFILFAQRGGLKPLERHDSTWFQAGRPYTGGRRSGMIHSGKPDAFYDLVEKVSPGPYLEMFARRARLGDWHYWGDQSLETASLEAA